MEVTGIVSDVCAKADRWIVLCCQCVLRRVTMILTVLYCKVVGAT